MLRARACWCRRGPQLLKLDLQRLKLEPQLPQLLKLHPEWLKLDPHLVESWADFFLILQLDEGCSNEKLLGSEQRRVKVRCGALPT